MYLACKLTSSNNVLSMQYTLGKKGWHMMKNCRGQKGRKRASVLIMFGSVVAVMIVI